MVCAAFELLDRSNNLTFKHHRWAMAAPPEERQRWLALIRVVRFGD